VARHIVVLDHGQKIAEGNPQDVVANAEVIRAYLGTGYAQAAPAAAVGDAQC
jgi:branched-chain amino acid transport system ATP-binding protein